MKITNKDKFAFTPKRCKSCNTLFWLELYNMKYTSVFDWGWYSVNCKRCIKVEEK